MAKRRVIYGPINYCERDYFNYLHSNLLIKLKDNLGENEFKISEDDMKKLYDLTKDKNYKNPDDIKISYVKVSGVDEKGNLKNDKKAVAKFKSDELKAKINAGESFENIIKTQSVQGNVKIEVGDKEFNSSNRRSEGENASNLLNVAEVLKLGQISAVVEEGDSFYILKCTERKGMGYRTYDEVKGSVKSNYVDEKFEEMIGKLVKDAKIEIVKDVFQKINVR